LLTVVQEADVHGVSTRKVDDLVKALGLDGLSKSEVSPICADLDPVVEAFARGASWASTGISGSTRRTTRSGSRAAS
jgi:transposase-like protein